MEYRFIIEDNSGTGGGEGILSGVGDDGIASGAGNSSSALAGATRKVTRVAENKLILAPINQMTNGFASPVYQLGKSIATGASAAAIGGGVAGLAIMGVMFGIQKLQEAHDRRLAELEKQRQIEAERNFMLVRAGRLDIYRVNTMQDKNLKIDRS